MSKRFISFLIGGLAVVLLGAPVQAQTRKANAFAQKTSGLNKQPGLLKSVAELDVSNLSLEKQAEFKEAAERYAAQQARPASQPQNFATVFNRRAVMLGNVAASTLYTMGSVQKAPKANAETVNAYGIITAPAEGEVKYYQRAGFEWFRQDNAQYYGEEEGYTEIVETADGVVYIKDFIGALAFNSYIKGTREGNTITIPSGQKIYQWEANGYGMVVNFAAYDNVNGFTLTKEGDPITLTVDGDVITLNEALFDFENGSGLVVGGFYTDQYAGQWSNFGTSNLVLTYDPSYVLPEVITLPEGVTAESYLARGQQYNGNSGAFVSYKGTANLAFDGNDVYLNGIFVNFPDAYIKGTKDGNTITFAGTQFIGTYGTYFMYGTGATGVSQGDVLADFVLEYNEADQVYVAQNMLLANAANDRVYFLEAFQNLEIAKAFGEPTAHTGDPVDVLPYTNNFDTSAKQAEFGIIDANEDGTTWAFMADGTARITYSNSFDSDDWLVSPAIYMEAGKAYRVAADIWSYHATYYDAFEVKLGTAAKASALTQTVIPFTNAVNTEAETYENTTVSVAESGYYHVGIHAVTPAGAGWYLYADNFVVEAGAEATAPQAVDDLTVVNSDDPDALEAVITFTAPAKSIDGNSLTENLTKIELYRDGEVVNVFTDVVPGSKVTFVDTKDNGLTLGTHKYQVIPYNASGVGAKSDVVSAFIEATITVPAFFDLSKADIFDLFQVIDANDDGRTWNFSTNYHAYSAYHSTNAADDYLVAPSVQLKGGKNYEITVNANAYSNSYPERFEVVIGKEATVEGLSTVVIPATELTSNTPDDYVGYFTAPEDGEYFVAVHSISDANMYYLQVHSLGIEAGLEPTAPTAPRVAVQPDPYGAEKAVITVTAPKNDISGDKLSAISHLDILRDGVVIKSYQDVAVEDIKVFVDTNVSGVHTYQAQAFDADGNRGEKSERTSVFVGLDVPAPVTNVHSYETVDGVVYTWDAVTTGANGGAIDPASLHYDIYTAHQEQSWFGYQWVLDEVIASTTDTSVEIPVDHSGNQALDVLFVAAVNAAGTGSAYGAYYLKGAPFQMPFEEHFAMEWNTGWTVQDATDNSDLGYSSDASDGDGGVDSDGEEYGSVLFTAAQGGEHIALQSAKISMRQGNPTLIADVKGDGSLRNALRVQVITPDGKVNTVSSIIPGTAYKTVKISLAEFANEPFVKVRFTANFKEAGNILLDNVKVTDLLEYNLAATIDAPASVQAGKSAKVNVVVRNLGEYPAEGYSVKVLAGDKVLLSQQVADALASFATKEFSADFETTIFDDADDVTLRAEVDYDLDLDDEDNVAETVISIKQSNASKPENVVASQTADGVKISWNAPSSSVEEVTDDFSSYANGADENGELGEWTLVNANGFTKGGVFNNVALASDGLVRAWQVFNIVTYGGDNDNFKGASGDIDDNYLISVYNLDNDSEEYPGNDDWLISPELPGVAQTISFDVRGWVDYGPQTYQVLYSTSGKELGDFTLLKEVTVSVAGWNRVSYDLPAGANYFAIRNITGGEEGFILGVDNITYTRGGGSVAGYNVYVDGELYDTVTATSIELKGVSASSTFAVSAVYANGQESQPVVVTVSGANHEITGISEIATDGQSVDVYTLDGRLVRKDASSLNGLKGAYIIKGRKVVLK